MSDRRKFPMLRSSVVVRGVGHKNGDFFKTMKYIFKKCWYFFKNKFFKNFNFINFLHTPSYLFLLSSSFTFFSLEKLKPHTGMLIKVKWKKLQRMWGNPYQYTRYKHECVTQRTDAPNNSTHVFLPWLFEKQE